MKAAAWLGGLCLLGLTLAAPCMAQPDSVSSSGRSYAEVDPWERFNRPVDRFNHALDRALVRPVAQAYDRWMPDVVRLMVGNMVSNLLDPYTALNNLLQGKPGAAASDLGRFFLNSTLGFFGVGDPATDVGLTKHREDFGQTLGVWRVPAGPYLVLPLLGPATVRDGLAFGVDAWAGLARRIDDVAVRNSVAGLDFFETRARLLPAQRVLDDALDPYLLLRDGYLQRRRSLIWDGNPPSQSESQEDGHE